MRVIYPIYLSLPSPLARSVQIVNTCYQLALAGVEVELLCAGRCDVEEIRAHYGLGALPQTLRIIALPALIKTPTSKLRFSSRLPWDFFLKRRIKKALRQGGKPLLYLRELKTARAVLPLIKRLELPSVYEVHRIEYRVEGRELFDFEQELYSAVSRIVCITGPLRDELGATFENIKLGPVLPSGCTPPDLSKLEQGSEYLFYAGQLYRWKGVDTIIKMMRLLPEERLVIAGGAQEEDLRRCRDLAAAEGVAEQVQFLGQLPPAAIAQHAAKAKALLLPNGDELYNRSYTSPIKLFEYLSYAKPIIASDLPTIAEIVEDGVSALLATPDDPSSFADAVIKLATRPELVQQLCDRAQALAPRYSWQSRALRLRDEVINQLQ